MSFRGYLLRMFFHHYCYNYLLLLQLLLLLLLLGFENSEILVSFSTEKHEILQEHKWQGISSRAFPLWQCHWNVELGQLIINNTKLWLYVCVCKGKMINMKEIKHKKSVSAITTNLWFWSKPEKLLTKWQKRTVFKMSLNIKVYCEKRPHSFQSASAPRYSGC